MFRSPILLPTKGGGRNAIVVARWASIGSPFWQKVVWAAPSAETRILANTSVTLVEFNVSVAFRGLVFSTWSIEALALVSECYAVRGALDKFLSEGG